MTFEEFTSLVDQHDLTFAYSDDGAVWRSGQAELFRIREEARNFPREDVVRVWNAKVDRTLVERARANFYWNDGN